MLEKKLTNQKMELELKADHLAKIDEKAENLLKSKNHVQKISINHF